MVRVGGAASISSGWQRQMMTAVESKARPPKAKDDTVKAKAMPTQAKAKDETVNAKAKPTKATAKDDTIKAKAMPSKASLPKATDETVQELPFCIASTCGVAEVFDVNNGSQPWEEKSEAETSLDEDSLQCLFDDAIQYFQRRRCSDADRLLYQTDQTEGPPQTRLDHSVAQRRCLQDGVGTPHANA